MVYSSRRQWVTNTARYCRPLYPFSQVKRIHAERATFLPQRATASSFTPCLCYKVGTRPVAFLHDPHIHLISSLNMSIKTTLVLIFAFVDFVQALPAPAREYFQYF